MFPAKTHLDTNAPPLSFAHKFTLWYQSNCFLFDNHLSTNSLFKMSIPILIIFIIEWFPILINYLTHHSQENVGFDCSFSFLTSRNDQKQ